MNTASNISAMQVSGAANAPQSQTQGRSSQGLLGFLDAFIQQIDATLQSGAATPAAQNSPPGLNTLAEKIAALLKKSGISTTDLQNMSPADLTAKIATLLQQQNVTIPPALQSLAPQQLATQLASQIQQNGALAYNSSGSGSGIQSSLTSDLVAPQSSNIQDPNVQEGQTKDDIAKKISTFLEQQQQQGTSAMPGPAQLQQLKAQIAQLQSAPGTISPDTLGRLTTDLGSFLASQGVSQTDISGFLADLTQTLQKDQTPSITEASATPTTTQTTPAATTAAVTAAAIPPVLQQPQTGTPAQTNTSAPTPQVADAPSSLPAKDIWSQGEKTPRLGANEPTTPATATDTPSQQSAAITQQQQPPTPQQNLTAKIAGFSVNPALISDLANNDSGTGSGSGFGSQGNNAQQTQDPAGAAALLQPATADMLQNQNFTNYLSSAPSSQASPTTQLVNIQLQNNINAGVNTMTLQLEPAELGKMDVKLSFARDGSVKAHMTVDKPETLALLQKDSSHLQRALQQSGLTTDENSLSFDLRQQSQQQNMNGFSGGGNADEFSTHMDGSDTANALQAQLAIQSSSYITSSGVNIMV